jgi:plastocyanin
MRILTKFTIALLAIFGVGVMAVSVSSHAPAGAADAGKKIDIKDFQYAPADLAAKVGDTITITNADDAPHTVTAQDGTFDVDVPGHGSATLKVPAAGEHPYACTYHPGQHNPAKITAS